MKQLIDYFIRHIPLESGEGLGIAPIGHNVTVEAANKVEIQLTTHLTIKGSS